MRARGVAASTSRMGSVRSTAAICYRAMALRRARGVVLQARAAAAAGHALGLALAVPAGVG